MRRFMVGAIIVILSIVTFIVLGRLITTGLNPQSVPATPLESVSVSANSASVVNLQLRQPSASVVCPEPTPRTTLGTNQLAILVERGALPADMVACFEQMYQVPVDWVEYVTIEEFYAKLDSEPGHYDLVIAGEYMLTDYVSKKRFQPLVKENIPAIRNLNPYDLNQQFDPGNKYTLPYQSGSAVLVANKNEVDPLPTSWQDLWKPEFATRLALPDNSRVVIGLALLALGLDPNTKVNSRLERTRENLTELVKTARLARNKSPGKLMSEGVAYLAVMSSAEAFLLQRAQPDMQVIYPSEGALFGASHYAILADAPHSDAAYAWLNYTMQGDLFWLTLRDTPYTISNKAALDFAKAHEPALFEAYINSSLTNPPLDIATQGKTLQDLRDFTKSYSKLWLEITEQMPRANIQ